IYIPLYMLLYRYVIIFYYFFFQAEDGIRDRNVTGVQTCALPILIYETWRIVRLGPVTKKSLAYGSTYFSYSHMYKLFTFGIKIYVDNTFPHILSWLYVRRKGWYN